MSTTTVLLVGVGGQGILLAAAVLANAALFEGLDVKASEVKGMAQRGGSVVSTVRFGPSVASPVAVHADVVLATELLEGRRALVMLAPGGTLVCAGTRIAPGSVLRREAAYPDDLAPQAAARGVRLVSVDADGLAARAGSSRAANVVLLGAASVGAALQPRSRGSAPFRRLCRPRSSSSIGAHSPSGATRGRVAGAADHDGADQRRRRSGSEGHPAHSLPGKPQRAPG